MGARWLYLGRLNLTAGPRAEGPAVRRLLAANRQHDSIPVGLPDAVNGRPQQSEPWEELTTPERRRRHVGSALPLLRPT